MKNVHERIKELLQNRSSGAQQLTEEALKIINELYDSNTTSAEILEFLNKCALQFYQMVPLVKIKEHFIDHGVNKESIHAFDKLLADVSYIKNASFLFDSKKKVLTFSNSSSVRKTLIHHKDKISEVICCRSLPLGEGKNLAELLSESGINVTLIEDSEAARYLSRCDFVLIGADAVTEEFFVNKVGTLQLILAARYFATPVYVVVSILKRIEKQHYLAEKLERYFEKIDTSLITEIIS